MKSLIVPGIFILFSLPVIIEDCKSLSLNPVFVYAGLFISALYSLIFERDFFVFSAVSAAGNFLFYLILHFILKNKLGSGDIKYAAFCGFICHHPFRLIYANLLASCSALLVFLILFLVKKEIKNQKLPFTPFMFAAALLSSFIRF